MGGITAGVGIFSGIDTQSLISQLLAIDARPKILAQRRIAQLQQQSAAFLDVNSALLALKTAGDKFSTAKTFKSASAASSNPEALVATAGTSATPGTAARRSAAWQASRWFSIAICRRPFSPSRVM